MSYKISIHPHPQKMKKYSTTKVRLEVKNATIISDKEEIDLGHLEGWSKKKATWIIKIEENAKLKVVAKADRAGKSTKSLKISPVY